MSSPEPVAAPATILVVDDHADARRLLALLLKSQGYRTLLAQDGPEALRLAEETPDLSLVILDVMMPGMDGLEVCRRLRARPGDAYVPIILATALSDEYTEKFYKELVHGKLQPVLDTLKVLAKKKMWFEIVYLVIPTHNDDPANVREMAKWIHGELGPDVPVHYSAFFPTYKLRNLERTPPETIERLWEVSRKEGLRYVYVGNVSRPGGHPGESTACPKCGRILIRRVRYDIGPALLRAGKCPGCETPIAGVWDGVASKP